MDYGKTAGTTGGGVTLLGVHLGYGWIILGAATLTALAVVGIRLFFKRNAPLGG